MISCALWCCFLSARNYSFRNRLAYYAVKGPRRCQRCPMRYDDNAVSGSINSLLLVLLHNVISRSHHHLIKSSKYFENICNLAFFWGMKSIISRQTTARNVGQRKINKNPKQQSRASWMISVHERGEKKGVKRGLTRKFFWRVKESLRSIMC